MSMPLSAVRVRVRVRGLAHALSNDQYAIFAPDVEAVTAEVLTWVPRSSKWQYILHLKNLPFLYYAHLPMSSNKPVN